MKRTAPKKVDRGARQLEAIEAIKRFQADQLDWDWSTLAEELDISVQHARNVMEALTLKGVLHHEVTTVKKRRLVLAPDAEQLAAA